MDRNTFVFARNFTFIGGGCCRNADRSIDGGMVPNTFGTAIPVACDWLVAVAVEME